ncbi:MAG: peptidoglycan DD-metalloendopeptidase family protein [Burkholderiaceae bacterium]|nr:peptidoglycan DD-metalloendopeptidase family protein [Burkholderiaceae bacterium]
MKKRVYPVLWGVSVLLAACTTTDLSAPVEDRSVNAPPSVQVPVGDTAPVGAGYHRVVKGDTLYRISRNAGYTVGDVAAWNNIANPAEINVGQVLRIVPPGVEPVRAVPVQTASVTDARGGVQTVQPVAPVVAPVAVPVSAPQSGVREVSGLRWSWPVTGAILRAFDEQTKGIDIEGTEGKRVLAAADGRVIYSGKMAGYGNLVIVKHSEDLLTAYAHNKTNLVSQESKVSRGTVVAEMGSSGADGVRLHFEVRLHGKPVDPLNYLPAPGR